MSDSLRTDRQRALDAPDADRDAKIEHLLVAGLDHYFAAQYDQAINVWTRALFLDRSHARARAYIERARSALAERQRKSEELLHTGVAAFERGDGGEARRLLYAAIADGAPSDEALAVLDRLNRLETSTASDPLAPPRGERRRLVPNRAGGPPRRARSVALALFMTTIVAVVGYVAFSQDRFDWRVWMPFNDAPAAGTAGLPARNTALPLPHRGEAALTRARALVASGHLRDAVAALDAVRVTDPQRSAADELRSEIQRQLLALAGPPASAAERLDRRVP